MAKKATVALALTGVLLAVAPMTGIANPTPESVTALEQVEQSTTFLDKTKAVLGGAKEQTVSLWSSMRNVDKRLAKKDEEIAFLKKALVDAERREAEKRYVSGVELERAKSCISTLHNFLEQQVEGK